MKPVGYKSVSNLMWRIMKNPLCSELTYEECAEYVLEGIKLIGSTVAYENKLSMLDLQMHKAELPCDILVIRGVRYFDCTQLELDAIDTFGRITSPIAMREATDIYHENPFENLGSDNTDFTLRSNHNRMEYTYTINKGIIFTSRCEGRVEVSYQGISTDEDGFPLIPDNEKVMLALEYYTLFRYLEAPFLLGKITDKAFEYINTKKCFYIASAQTSLNMPSMDQAASMFNGINRLILNTTAHESFFKKNGEVQRIRKFR